MNGTILVEAGAPAAMALLFLASLPQWALVVWFAVSPVPQRWITSRTRSRHLLEVWGIGGVWLTMAVGIWMGRLFGDAGRPDTQALVRYVVLGEQVVFAAVFIVLLFLRQRRAAAGKPRQG